MSKVPREFLTKYLKAKGWKEQFHVSCDCCSVLEEDVVEHPVKWLWEHVEKGHEPMFDACHSWDRQVGRDTGDFEYWYKWWMFMWSQKLKEFICVDCYQGCNGLSGEEQLPHELHESVRVPIRERQFSTT